MSDPIIRLAEPADWLRLEEIFQREFHRPAPPLDATVCVAIAEDPDTREIVGVMGLQLIPTIEPTWVAPSWRTRFHAVRLWELIMKSFPRLNVLFTHCEDERVARAAAKFTGGEVTDLKTVRWVKHG